MGKLFDELKRIKEEYDRKLQSEGKAAVQDVFKDLFEKFPEIRSVVWRQYTPYFNDGDACNFGVRSFDVYVGTNEDDDDYRYGETVYDLASSNDSREKEVAEAIRALERELPKDVLEAVFGDHVEVVATRLGFNVTECNHD